jgi:hypothetical protein
VTDRSRFSIVLEDASRLEYLRDKLIFRRLGRHGVPKLSISFTNRFHMDREKVGAIHPKSFGHGPFQRRSIQRRRPSLSMTDEPARLHFAKSLTGQTIRT